MGDHIRLGRDPVLYTKCVDVDPGEDVRSLLARMKNACESGGGVGLAAPQIGVLKNVILITLPGAEGFMINPRVLRTGTHKKRNREKCLSFPDKIFMVDRWTKIWVTYLNENGTRQSVKAKELVARIIQHEMDHLNGITLLMRGTEVKR